MNIERILSLPKGKTLEFKRDLSSPRNVLKSIVAFANTAGGTVVIGVEDGSRNFIGVSDPYEEEERLANIVSDRIRPRLAPEIDIVPYRGGYAIAVEVHLSSGRPHYVLAQGSESKAYVRVGSTNRLADSQMLEELARSARYESFDERPLIGETPEEIDRQLFFKLLGERRAIKEGDLETLRLVAGHQGKQVPTIGGILTFGRNPQSHFPDARIECALFEGVDKGAIRDQLSFSGGIVENLSGALEFVEKHNRVESEILPGQREDRNRIPLVAARELIVNAVAHADYSQAGSPIRIALFDNRLEIENPGLLLPGLLMDDLKQGISKLRNRVIGRVLRELGYMEQWGSGVKRAIADCTQGGLREPELVELGSRFRATIYLDREASPSMNAGEQAVHDLLRSDSSTAGMSSSEIAGRLNVSDRTVRTRLKTMIGKGVIVAIGKGKNDPKRRYKSISDS